MIITNENSIRHKLISVLGNRLYDSFAGLLGTVYHPRKTINSIRTIIALGKKNIWKTIDCGKVWKRGFGRLLLRTGYFDDTAEELFFHFVEDKLLSLKEADVKDYVDPIVVCTVKDDLIRIKQFVAHYRKLGVQRFLVIDNGSKDGTKEFLLEQPDVSLYATDERFSSITKASWNNRVISINGLNHWYLIVDSDEFFVFPEMEEMNLCNYVNKLSLLGKKCTKSLLLELYPKYGLLDDSKNDEDFVRDYKFFDMDSDWYSQDAVTGKIFGGVHYRCFESKYALRSKVPLIYYDGGRFARSAHEMMPLYENNSTTIGSVLLHYKWLPSERKKIKNIIKYANYHGGSILYKRYEQNIGENTSLFYEGSREWDGVGAFQYLPFISGETYSNQK